MGFSSTGNPIRERKEIMKKRILKLKIKYEQSLIKKYLELKKELKRERELKEAAIQENHKLIDEITLKNIKIRELSLEK